ncbi:MAG: hypothetical protein M1818_002315 [Claussenomyces sp. TS43310]|nr:MAG: hypothetical protein M1818_002315 [Claussenomyces sp. TS43310]
MNDNRSHPLLAQIPLTVSPFISLPTATTLPYTYKTLPSTLPPSSTGTASTSDNEKSQYIVSSNGHAAHPDDIIASCKTLQAHLQKVRDGAERTIKAWEAELKEKDLAEKRRVAPGWLDSDARILEPERKNELKLEKSVETGGQDSLMDMDASSAEASGLKDVPAQAGTGVGDELDRAFGGMELR